MYHQLRIIILSIVILSIFRVDSMAQSSTRSPFDKGWHFGARVGTNIMNYNDNNPPAHFRPMADIFIEYRFIKALGLNLGVGYSDQLHDPLQSEGGSNHNENAKLLTIPITITARIAGPVSFNTGVVFGFGLKQSSSIYAYNIRNTSIPLGLSYTTKFGLLVDIRYHIALAGFTQISVGYKF